MRSDQNTYGPDGTDERNPDDPHEPQPEGPGETRPEGPRERKLRVLVVEDEPITAADFAQIINRMGGSIVGPSYTLEEGLKIAEQGAIDFALLDIVLQNDKATSIADCLGVRGIPFAFVSGYDISGLPERYRDVPYISKPCLEEDVRSVVSSLLRNRHGGEAGIRPSHGY